MIKAFSHGQKKVKCDISFLHCIEKTKYTRRCSMKSSTIYKEQLSKDEIRKKYAISYWRNSITQNFVHFENKKCNYKISSLM
jgi:hypothetical protein